MTIQIQRTGTYDFIGRRLDQGGVAPGFWPGFYGEVLQVRTTADFILRWVVGPNQDVPGVAPGIPYWGKVSADGKQMSGDWGASPSQNHWPWSAQLISNTAAAEREDACRVMALGSPFIYGLGGSVFFVAVMQK